MLWEKYLSLCNLCGNKIINKKPQCNILCFAVLVHMVIVVLQAEKRYSLDFVTWAAFAICTSGNILNRRWRDSAMGIQELSQWALRIVVVITTCFVSTMHMPKSYLMLQTTLSPPRLSCFYSSSFMLSLFH